MALTNKEAAKRVIFEQKILLLSVFVNFICIVIWLVAIGTSYWVVVDAPNGVFVSEHKYVFLRSNAGLLRVCTTFATNLTRVENGDNSTVLYKIEELCEWSALFPSRRDIKRDRDIDTTILDHTRSEVAFSLLSLMLMAMGQSCSIYTFRQHRYMYKRLAAMFHFFSAVCILIVIEVFRMSVVYERNNIPSVHPRAQEKEKDQEEHREDELLPACAIPTPRRWRCVSVSLSVSSSSSKALPPILTAKFFKVSVAGTDSNHSATWYYGYSYMLSWVVMIDFVMSGIAFMVCSRKKKRDKAPTADWASDDEPHILGRL
ncbi:unnamed protein product [Cyprideis torosa]|uniref:Uncharacterized protein n=1 Tax=Cyprideis torosa TaxID=163714 RepID=A0A7R8W877_9CRUS|nr:unnamed protein product [Cyprideis torosa]CAG0888328.1 unnamed protein product [Cyprideis torosa]